MEEQWGPLEEAGFIKRHYNPRLVHEPVIVPKKDAVTGAWTDSRLCIDFGAGTGGVNKYTPADSFQLPLVDDLFAQICQGGRKLFSVCDAKSGYQQTHLDASVQDLACFWFRN